MKYLLGVLALCGGLSLMAYAGPENRYLLVLDRIQPLADLMPSELVYTDGGISIVKLPFHKVEKWSEAVHKAHHACGGFIDVTEEVASGQMPELIVWKELDRDLDDVQKFEVTLQKSELINQLVKRASGDQMWTFLTELSAMPDRSATTANGKKAADFLKARATELAANVPGFTAILVETNTLYPQPSVVATIPGLDPTLPGVVIGGHFDTFSNGKPGADDDGSGTTVVMEALRVITASRATFDRTIHFAWYAAEERGLVGSSYVVKHFTKNNLPVFAALQFDMVGFKSPRDKEDVYLVTDYTNADLNRTLKEIITTYTTATVGETECGYACSDHANWHRQGIPAAIPFEASFDNMNDRLHTEDDKIEYLDPNHAVKFAQTALGYLGEVAVLRTMDGHR